MSPFTKIAATVALLVPVMTVEAQSPLATPAAIPPLGAVVAVRQSESVVREMPLEQRPNRLGHFYGNNVRRRQQGTLFVNRKHTDRPLARYFYIAR